MFRKVIATATASVLIALAFSAAPASAATKISNGIPCVKAGTVKKASGSNYRCAKNTLVKNSKLTWLSFECLDSIKQFRNAAKAQVTLNSSGEDIKILNERYESVSAILVTTTTVLDDSKAAITKAQSTMNATTDVKKKADLSIEVRKLADAIIKLTNSKLALNNQVRDLDRQRKLISTAPQQLKTAASDARGYAKLLCTRGL
jgi:hypothetical protein